MRQDAVTAFRAKDWARTEALCLQILSGEPADATALHVLGLVRSAQGRALEALALLDAALASQPKAADILANRGLVLQSLGRLDEALACLDAALALETSSALQLRRGMVLAAMARMQEACACFDSVLAREPENPSALYNRANALSALGRFGPALADYEKLLSHAPDHANAWNNRGNALNRTARPEEALESFERALALRPNLMEAHYNRGTVLQELGRNIEALASYDVVVAANPDHIQALTNRGAVLRELKRFAEAAASFEQALAAGADNGYALGGLADCLLNLCDWRRREELTNRLEGAVRDIKKVISPLTFLGYSDDPALQQACSRAYTREIAGTTSLASAPVYKSHGKIRLAYLSADFHEHATSFLMAELFARHDRARFDVIGLSYGVDDGSDMRTRLAASFDQFHDIRRKTDEEAAELLRTLEVDIAVDLKGHTHGARPGILGRRPCPIQVNYLGYPGTMGADFIDYIIADAVVLPDAMQPFFDETIIRLEGCYQANPATRPAATTTPSRQECGLPDQGIVFCCFNNNWKITPTLFALWMRLLKFVPDSVIWLLDDNIGARRNLCAHAGEHGVSPDRLVFAPRMRQAEHLARHRLADLFLDTLPYNAHTTASDALWMGLPVITCLGRAFPGRVAASLLQAAQLPELIAENMSEYERLALDLANNPLRLRSIKRQLESNRTISQLFDTEKFRKNLEEAYFAIWRRSIKP